MSEPERERMSEPERERLSEPERERMVFVYVYQYVVCEREGESKNTRERRVCQCVVCEIQRESHTLEKLKTAASSIKRLIYILTNF